MKTFSIEVNQEKFCIPVSLVKYFSVKAVPKIEKVPDSELFESNIATEVTLFLENQAAPFVFTIGSHISPPSVYLMIESILGWQEVKAPEKTSKKRGPKPKKSKKKENNKKVK